MTLQPFFRLAMAASLVAGSTAACAATTTTTTATTTAAIYHHHISTTNLSSLHIRFVFGIHLISDSCFLV